MPRTLYDITPLTPLVEAGFVLLTPNWRLARRVKAEWDAARAASGTAVWEPIAVQPLEQWLLNRHDQLTAGGAVPPQIRIAPLQVMELWQQIIQRDQQASGDYSLLRPEAAANLAAQARDTLLQWQVDIKSAQIRPYFEMDADCAAFLRWLELFEKRLIKNKLITPVDAIMQLLANTSSLTQEPLALLEFDDIAPLYRATVEALGSEVRRVNTEGRTAERRLYGCDDKRAELQIIARWAAQTSRSEPDARLGIVLSDMVTDRNPLEYLLRREFDCLGENYTSLPVNFSTGIALDRAPIVRDALTALSLAGRTGSLQQILSLLRSRFVRLPDASSPLAQYFVSRLYQLGQETLELADVRYLASNISLGPQEGLSLGAILMAISGMRELRTTAQPSMWVDRFCQVLDQWGWPGGDTLDSLEYQQLELWYRTLDEFRHYDAVCGAVSFDTAVKLLKASCAAQISQPQTPDGSVQVLGPLEAAGLKFDQLWISGMQAARWPPPATPNPLIPVSLQARLDMPHATAEREWSFASALLAQYRGSCAVLHASYCRQIDDVPELPSPLLEGFLPIDLETPPEVDPSWQAQWLAGEHLLLSDDVGPPVGEEELDTVAGGSALLEDQSQCPFRAFARRRLQAEPIPDYALALTPAERGSLLHAALQSVWGQFQNRSTLLALTEAEETDAVAEAVREAVKNFPSSRKRLFGPAYWQLESQRLSDLLTQWLALEKTRSEFAVEERELDIKLELGQLPLNLKVDRIDRLADGSQLIIDYKSGRSSIQDWIGNRPAKPQLLLYSVAAPGEAAALSFGQVRPRDCKFVGMGKVEAAPGISTNVAAIAGERMPASDWEELNAQWRQNLEQLAQEFIDGHAYVDPLNASSCTWCGLQSLCRIASDDEISQ